MAALHLVKYRGILTDGGHCLQPLIRDDRNGAMFGARHQVDRRIAQLLQHDSDIFRRVIVNLTDQLRDSPINNFN
ncbi:hypothetical protein A9W98_00670 [Mycobacterium gordonae]|uniref:Uncharacterized protein n=1 Tax=Mycobacterium gordonae TaxID=1778 RepID=A0A1A6BMS0_MYCGO|nr:hypothetical protein A9W98_00670 [Mycobacterium gordonae]